MYQWADTERIAFGLAKAAPSAAHFFVYGFARSAFIGFPCPMNSAGVRCDMAQSPTLLLAAVRPAAHRLFLHAHEAAGGAKEPSPLFLRSYHACKSGGGFLHLNRSPHSDALLRIVGRSRIAMPWCWKRSHKPQET